jgi:hypothetical protein
LSLPGSAWFSHRVERVAHKATSFEDARRWDLEQYRRMSPDERRRVAKELRRRVYGDHCPDVRDAMGGLRRRRAAKKPARKR